MAELEDISRSGTSLWLRSVEDPRGLTLLEVVVSMLILLLLSLGFYQVFIPPAQWVGKAGQEGKAGHLAYAMLEMARAWTYDNPGGSLEDWAAGMETAGVPSGEESGLPGIECRLDSRPYPDAGYSGLYQVRVTVTWEMPGREPSVSLVTLVRQAGGP